MKHATLFICLLISPFIKAQLSACSWSPVPVHSMEQARTYILKHPRAGAEVLLLTSTQDTTDRDREIYRYENGDVFTMNGYLYKVLNIQAKKQYNVSYVFLNGDKLSKRHIDSTEARIIAEYKSGKPFQELIKAYFMDGDPDMESSLWFSSNERLPEFMEAVEKHQPGEVYTVEIPSKQFYYVVKAGNAPRIQNVYTVFRMPVPAGTNTSSYSSN